MSEVSIRKVKRSGPSALWGANVVQRDDYGVWLYTPRGSLYSPTSSEGDVVVRHNG